MLLKWLYFKFTVKLMHSY